MSPTKMHSTLSKKQIIVKNGYYKMVEKVGWKLSKTSQKEKPISLKFLDNLLQLFSKSPVKSMSSMIADLKINFSCTFTTFSTYVKF